MLGLDADFAVPVEAEPGEVLEDGGVERGAAAGGVDVLDTEEEAPAGRARAARGEEGGVGVAEMEEAGGARGETRYGGGRVLHAGIILRRPIGGRRNRRLFR